MLMPLGSNQSLDECKKPSLVLSNGNQCQFSTGVSHQIFQKRLSSMVSWFSEFNDVQKNRVISDILVGFNDFSSIK